MVASITETQTQVIVKRTPNNKPYPVTYEYYEKVSQCSRSIHPHLHSKQGKTDEIPCRGLNRRGQIIRWILPEPEPEANESA